MAKANETASDAGAADGAIAERPRSVLDGINDPVRGPAVLLALEEIARKWYANDYHEAVERHSAAIRAERGEPDPA